MKLWIVDLTLDYGYYSGSFVANCTEILCFSLCRGCDTYPNRQHQEEGRTQGSSSLDFTWFTHLGDPLDCFLSLFSLWSWIKNDQQFCFDPVLMCAYGVKLIARFSQNRIMDSMVYLEVVLCVIDWSCSWLRFTYQVFECFFHWWMLYESNLFLFQIFSQFDSTSTSLSFEWVGISSNNLLLPPYFLHSRGEMYLKLLDSKRKTGCWVI